VACICIEGQEGNTNRQRHGVLVFSEQASFPSAGSLHRAVSILPWVVSRGRSYGFLRADSIIHICEERRSNSGLFTSKRSKALSRHSFEVHWVRRVQAPMPQISGPNLQENHIIETCKKEGCATIVAFMQRGQATTLQLMNSPRFP
jgi:hypothetical protein